MSDIVLVPEISNEQDTHMVPILKERIIFLKFSELNLHFHWSVPFYKILIPFVWSFFTHSLFITCHQNTIFFWDPVEIPSSMKSFQISSAGSPISLLILPESHSTWFDSIFHYLVSDLITYVFFNFGSQYSVIGKPSSITTLVMHYYYIDNCHFYRTTS